MILEKEKKKEKKIDFETLPVSWKRKKKKMFDMPPP